jgi:hypothetical protein
MHKLLHYCLTFVWLVRLLSYAVGSATVRGLRGCDQRMIMYWYRYINTTLLGVTVSCRHGNSKHKLRQITYITSCITEP